MILKSPRGTKKKRKQFPASGGLLGKKKKNFTGKAGNPRGGRGPDLQKKEKEILSAPQPGGKKKKKRTIFSTTKTISRRERTKRRGPNL